MSPKSGTPNLDELKERLAHLQKLLDDPHPGLMTWSTAYLKASNRVLDFFGKIVPESQDGDLLGTDVLLPSDPKEMLKPTCSKCGGEIPFFYFYVYKLQSTQGVMVFQASCCPHANCRALFIVLPIGMEAGSVAVPGKPGWPGVPS